MYADRNAKRHGLKPGSFALALAVNGAILGGLVLFANPTFKKTIDTVMTLDPIALDPVKPPPPPPPQPKPEKSLPQAQHETIDTSKAVTVTKVADPTPIDPPPIGPVEGAGGGGSLPLAPVKPVPPVLTDPLVDQRYANLFQPVYPPDEQRMGHNGRVVVRVLIGVDGRVKDIEQVSATSDSFFAVTRRRAFDKWRFKPGTRDGIPVEAWRVISVSFVLNDAD